MRLPNGYGSITKLSGKRRKPFMVRITTGYDNEGKQLMSVLGYYTTRNEALAMLAEYNKNPYNHLLAAIAPTNAPPINPHKAFCFCLSSLLDCSFFICSLNVCKDLFCSAIVFLEFNNDSCALVSSLLIF